jgi:ATP-dependent DNA ligase
VSEDQAVPKGLPFPPMEAQLVRELPDGDGWQYEPKWDGFRGVLENLGGGIRLWSRNARPLLRYFPELADLGERLPPESALDGEVVIERDGRLSFESLQMRLHPAESRITKLSQEIPASYVVFDVLVWEGEDVHGLPLEERRARVEKLPFAVSPASRDRELAAQWEDDLDPAGFDGVIAKRLGSPYLPGSREAVVKVKKHRSADCVVIGVTWSEKATGFASLMLGLYENGKVRPVGTAAAGGPKRDEITTLVEPLLGKNPERRPRGEPTRWQKEQLEWSPIEPKLVVEVRYDKWQAGRFRHGTKFLRFRPDKDPEQCTVDQVEQKPGRGDVTVSGLLER